MNNNGSGCGITFTVLFIQTLFIILKVTGSVDWNNWIVWSPILLTIGIVIILILALVAVGALSEMV